MLLFGTCVTCCVYFGYFAFVEVAVLLTFEVGGLLVNLLCMGMGLVCTFVDLVVYSILVCLYFCCFGLVGLWLMVLYLIFFV